MYIPEAVGVPLIVMVFAAQVAVTPAGKRVATPIPVAPVVVWVIGVNATFVHNAGVVEGAVTVLLTLITIVPVAP